MNIPVKATSVEYAKPYRPRLIAVFNFIGRTLRRLGLQKRGFEEKSLLNAARRKSGVEFTADDSFKMRMRLLIQSLEHEARLHPFGRFMARQNLVRFLSNRLKIEAAFKKHPEILDIQIKDPVFIVGLQRTGTTMLHRLLASDTENFRFLSSWEAINPAPLSSAAPGSKDDPRVKTAHMAQKALEYMAPDFFAIHPIGPFEPEEDCLLFDYDFWSTVPEATMRVPSFSRWLEAQDHEPAYLYYKNVLKYLYWQNPRGRWILKTPQHMEHFEDIFRVFPGARIIQTHRDPARVVASFCSMVSHAYGVFSDEVDIYEIGSHWSRKALKMVHHSMDIRERIGPEHFIDVQYSDLMSDPSGVVKRIYDFLGIPFGADTRERSVQWVRENPQHRHGRHQYRLEDFGLSRSDIEQMFDSYRTRFNVKEEKEPG
jgi:hypothetical protein